MHEKRFDARLDLHDSVNMKTLLHTFVMCLLLMGLYPNCADAAKRGTPYIPEVDQRFSDNEDNITTNTTNITAGAARSTVLEGFGSTAQYGTAGISGILHKRVSKSIWEASALDGAGPSTMGAKGNHAFGTALPANAVINRVYYEIATAVPQGYNIGFGCDSGTGGNALSSNVDLHAATAGKVYFGKFYQGTTTDGASTTTAFQSSACTPTIHVNAQQAPSGRIILFVEYVVGE